MATLSAQVPLLSRTEHDAALSDAVCAPSDDPAARCKMATSPGTVTERLQFVPTPEQN